jgi:hypothetical protein
MENWIENVCEPSRLILAWQAPDQIKDRHRWAVGELARSGDDYVFRYFHDDEEFASLNPSKTWQQLLEMGYRGYPAFDLKTAVHRERALAPFLRRIPPRTRKDFREYQVYFRLGQRTSVSDFALLGLTEAKLPSDGFSLVNTFDCQDSKCEVFLEVAGHRYYADAASPLHLGEAVGFFAEPDNKHDPNALQVTVRSMCVGYVNRLQASAFHRWSQSGRLSGVVERLNGTKEKPRLFIFVRVEPAPDKAHRAVSLELPCV